MLGATPKTPRKQYVVKYGYVYSNITGNYQSGDVVELTDKEYELARHRLSPYRSKDQVKLEGEYRSQATLYGHKPEPKAPTVPEVNTPEVPKEPEVKDPVTEEIGGLMGRGGYEVK